MEKVGIDKKQFHLIFNGKKCADDVLLSDYNIKAGNTLHMILMLRGGCWFIRGNESKIWISCD